MMRTVSAYLPGWEDAVGMPTPALAVLLLRYFNDTNAAGGSSLCHPHNILNQPSWSGYDVGNWALFSRAVSEAWAYLVANALVARVPGNGDYHMITRRGMEAAKQANPEQRLADEGRLGVGLHTRINDRVRQQFLLGEYELAAFAAMREVEIRVRELAGEPESEIGVKLVQKVFREGGTLSDPALDEGEQQATMALFWGAIGVFKNPSSHRQVRFEDPTQAAEIILFADLLLRLLDRHAARLGKA